MLRVPQGIAFRAPREWFPALTVAVALVLSCPANADVQVKQKTVSEGLSGFGNSTTQGTTIISGDQSRSEDEVTYTGRFKTLAGGGKPQERVTITRLDQETIWTLDPAKKQYQEMTFEQMRAMMKQGADQASKGQKPQDADMKFSVDVKKTGARQDVNGFPCEQVIITVTGTPTDPKLAAQGSSLHLTMDQWLTKKGAGADEMRAFARKFAEKLGEDPGLSGMVQAARRMYGGGIQQLGEKLKDLDGYPIRSTFTIENALSGENQEKLATAQQQAAAAQGQADSAMAAHQGDIEAAQKKADAADAAEAGASVKGGKGVGGALGGFFAKKMARAASKKAEQNAEQQSHEMAASGSPAGGPMFKSVTEVVSITREAAPAGSFEIPAGYTKKSK